MKNNQEQHKKHRQSQKIIQSRYTPTQQKLDLCSNISKNQPIALALSYGSAFSQIEIGQCYKFCI